MAVLKEITESSGRWDVSSGGGDATGDGGQEPGQETDFPGGGANLATLPLDITAHIGYISYNKDQIPGPVRVLAVMP